MIKSLFSIYLNYLINYFALNTLVVLLYLFDHKQLVIDIALFGSFAILLCQIFAFNSRTLLLSVNKTVDIIPIIIQRIILSLVILLICVFFAPFFIANNYSLGICVAFALIGNWIFEIILTDHEIKKNQLQKYHFLISIFSFFGIFFSIFLSNFLFLKLFLIIYSILIFFKIILYIIKNINNLDKKKYSIKSFIGIHFLSSFGSSLSISVSSFLFRYFIIILSSLEISSAVIIGFMFGSLPVSLFYNIFGATLVKNKVNLEKYKIYFFYFSILIFITILFFISKFKLDFFINFFYLDNILFISIFFSILGMFPMLIGLYKRQKIIQETNSKDKFFNLDIIYSLSVIIIVPLVYILNNEMIFSICFLLSGIFAYLIFSFSNILKNKNFIYLFLFLVPLPIFFIFLDTFKKFNFFMINESNSQVLENLYSLPIPLSLMILPFFLISLLHRYQFMLISIYLVTLSFLIGIISVVYLQRLSFSNFLNVIQFFLPMFGLIIGEIVGKINLYQKLFFKNLYLISLIVIILQLLLTITYGSNNLVSNIFGIYIYQSSNFTSTVFFLGLFSYLVFYRLKNFKFNLILDYFLLFLISVYLYYANSISLYLFVLFFIVYNLIFKKIKIVNNLYLLLFLVLSFYISTEVNIKNFFNHFDTIILSNKHFLENSLNNYELFLFGSNLNNELYLSQIGVFNFYIDYVYNFGFLSLIPFLFLISYTIIKTYRLKKIIFKNNLNYVLFYLFIFIIFIDSFLRTGLKQPFIGIIYYLIWGIYLSKLHIKRKNEFS